MKPSELIKEVKSCIQTCGDNDMYILSKINGKGIHVGKIISVGIDCESGIIIETDIESTSCTK